MSEFLPCPFCGSKDLIEHVGYRASHVMCKNCFACGPITYNSESFHWNNRANPEAAPSPKGPL